MNPPFSPYEKMPHDLRKLKLSEADYRRLAGEEWIVTEKIHGANFAFISNGIDVHHAKRKALLAPSEDFFGFQIVHNAYSSRFRSLAQKVIREKDAEWVMAYGELFGGGYPHSAVQACAGVNLVQTGVYYSKWIEFMAFDLAWFQEGEWHFTSFSELQSLGELFELPVVPLMFRGKLNEALEINIDRNTEIPEVFNLPPIEGNTMEGIVIKTDKPIFLETPAGRYRPIFKKKNEKFSEVKYHEAQPWSLGLPIFISQADNEWLFEHIEPYLTPQRMENAISKIGIPSPLTVAFREEVLDEFGWDAVKSFGDDHGDIYGAIDWEWRNIFFAKCRIIGLKILEDHLNERGLNF